MSEQAAYSLVGRLARECLAYGRLLRRSKSRPTVLFLPTQGREDGASNLRAYEMAAQLRRLNWNAEVVPKHLDLRQRRRMIAAFMPDLLVMQTARHPLNRPHLYPDHRTVFDLDDADYIDLRSQIGVDEALAGAVAVIAGSRNVARYCRARHDDVSIVWTGAPIGLEPPSQETRGPIVTWAVSNPASYTAEAVFVLKVLAGLRRHGTAFTYRFYGHDGGAANNALLSEIQALGIKCDVRPYMDYKSFVASLWDISIGLAPLVSLDGFSSGKSFGKVLAYLDAGVPIITHPVVDHPLLFQNGINGFLAQSVGDWVDQAEALLHNAILRSRLAAAGRHSFVERLSIGTAAELTNHVLKRLL